MKNKILQIPLKWVVLGIVVAVFAGHSLQTAFGLRTEFGWEIKTLPESNSAKWITSTQSIKVQGIVTADEDIKGITATYTISPALPFKPELLKITSNISVPKSLTVEKTFENLPDGTYDIQFEVSLTSTSSLTQTTKSKIETIKKDTVPPEIKIKKPESIIYTDTVLIDWEIGDKTSETNPSVELSFRKVSPNEDFTKILDTSDSPYAWTPPSDVSGPVELRIVAKDNAGNRSESKVRFFIRTRPSKIYLPLLGSDRDIYEPNDTFALANKALSLPTNLPIITSTSGIISSVKDIDFFAIDLAKGRYKISITFNSGDLDLYVYNDPRKEALEGKSDSTDKTTEEVTLEANPLLDTYFIAIAAYVGSPPTDFPILYTLTIRKE